MSPRRARAAVLAVVSIGVVVRLWAAFEFAPPRLSWGDEAVYLQRAASVAATGDPASAWQPPLYAYVLALATFAEDSIDAARLIQIALFLATAAGLVVLAGGWRRALPPMLVLSLYPCFVALSWLLLSESLFFALFVWALALQRFSSPGSMAASGVFWGLATLTRAIGLPFFAMSLLLHSRAFPGRVPTARGAAILGLGFAVTLAPWLVRNQVVLGSPTLNTSTWFNVWVANEDTLTPAYAWRTEDLGVFLQHYERWSDDEVEREGIAMRRAMDFIAREQPGWIFRKTWSGVTHLMAHDNYILRRLHRHGPDAAARRPLVAGVTLAAEFAVVVWGIWWLLSVPPSPRRTLVLGMLLVATAAHIATIGDSRHRLGIEMAFFGLTGCNMRPFAARRLVVAIGITALLAGLGFFAPEAGPSRLFR